MKEKSNSASAPLINEKIRSEKVQVITNTGNNLGVVTREEAMKLAREADLDMVLLSDTGGMGVPVVKIMDFGKALYAKKKQQTEAKKNQKVIQVKEIKMSPKIGDHDYQIKVSRGIEFLKEGKHLKVTLEFKGREAVTREERGESMFQKIDQSLQEAGLTKVVHEKDSKTGKSWTRVYYTKK